MKNKKWQVAGLVIFLLSCLLLGAYLYWGNKSSAANGKFKEFTVQRGNLAITILSTGVVQPENRVEVKPPIPGRIETVLVQEGQKVKKGQRLAWMSSIERAALLDAASSKGAAELKIWEEMYRPTAILAPIDGLIIQRKVESGQTISASDAIVVVSDRLTVKAQVDETDIAAIALKQKAYIELDAYPNRKIPAMVDQIAFDAKTVNNVTTYIVDVLADSTPEKSSQKQSTTHSDIQGSAPEESIGKLMRSGMTANVTFFVDSRKNVLLVPVDAMRLKEGVSTVLRKKSAKSHEILEVPAEVRVELGLSDGKKTEIVSGLEEGDIIMTPEFRLEGKRGGSSPFSPMGSRPKSK